MQIVINIPKEFENHFNNDRFNDSLGRVIFDIKQCNRHGSEYDALSGNYEIETLEMLEDSLENATVLPEGQGRLGEEKGHWIENIINRKTLYSCSECLHIVSNYDGHFHYCPYCGKELKGVIRNDKNK